MLGPRPNTSFFFSFRDLDFWYFRPRFFFCDHAEELGEAPIFNEEHKSFVIE